MHRPLGTRSLGERLAARGVAALVASGAELLLLDEPTNHLDFDSLDVVEAALPPVRGDPRGRHARPPHCSRPSAVDRVLEVRGGTRPGGGYAGATDRCRVRTGAAALSGARRAGRRRRRAGPARRPRRALCGEEPSSQALGHLRAAPAAPSASRASGCPAGQIALEVAEQLGQLLRGSRRDGAWRAVALQRVASSAGSGPGRAPDPEVDPARDRGRPARRTFSATL